jgi:competence ComEA-like helix-hairpin-helix protein
MKRPLSTLQTLLGSTRSEAIVVLILLGGLLAGQALSWWERAHRQPWEESATARDIAAILDTTERRAALADSMALVPVHNEQPSSLRSQRSQAPHPVNLNIASVTELATLPGIGAKTAEKIIERRKMRPFRTPEDIMDVRGIGQKKYERMRPFLRVQ